MLTIHNMHKLAKTNTEPPPKSTMLKMSDLPRRKVIAASKKPNPEPQKILTISDLPRRTAAMRKQQATSRREMRRGIPGKHRNLGPKTFANYVKNNAWAGRRCFVIGGGPSIKKQNLDLLRGELTIGINRAYELLSPSILFGVDSQMWGWAEQGKLGAESKQKMLDYKGYKVWMAITHRLFPPDYYLIDADDRGGYRVGTTKILSFKNNSGYGAINLAAALGANPIYLLGFDMECHKEGKQEWWHDGYPLDYGDNVYDAYIREITAFAPVLKGAGFNVINLSPKSALKCFSFGNYKKVVEKKPVVAPGAMQSMARPGTLTVITPTGDRPLAFALCKQWMAQQTRQPDQWIVVDDGVIPTAITPNMTYIRRKPMRKDPVHTLIVNLRKAMPHINGEKILIMEDDEYYAPGYIERMSTELDSHEVVGIMESKYYHLPTAGFLRISNRAHASLAQTGFTRSFLPDVEALLRSGITQYLDMNIWQNARTNGKGFLFHDKDDSLYLGIKGMPGRGGIGSGHNPTSYTKKDTSRETLKEWAPHGYRAYIDIMAGKLTEHNADSYFPDITGIVVCQNSINLITTAYLSVRKFHPEMPIIIIDGSDRDNPCASYVKGLISPLTTVVQPGYNIGHGKGMCMGIDMVRTKYALIFDSDIEMLKSPVNAMLAMMEHDTFGVGYTEKTAPDGFEWGAGGGHNHGEPMKMLHPYFHLIDVGNYHKYHPYVHHGAPCYLTALDIHNKGLSDKIIKEFPGLGHSSGKGWVWEGKPREFIKHDPAGTRNLRRSKGQPEIEGNWTNK